MIRVLPGSAHCLYGTEASRAMEVQLASQEPEHALMELAGTALAKLALALAPHGRTFWIACGPGNNGGDGLEAALNLKAWGKTPVVTWLGNVDSLTADSLLSYKRVVQAGIDLTRSPPTSCDLCIDALLGIGCSRPVHGEMAHWIQLLNDCPAPVLAADLPSGLNSDTGSYSGSCIRANFTLSLLTLKPGLFTAAGRDMAGQIWFDPLVENTLGEPVAPTAILSGAQAPASRLHASHKGSFGDVSVIGGANGMVGAALLAAYGALHFGAGRVYIGLLESSGVGLDTGHPELMFRPIDSLLKTSSTIVCGCGGSDAIGTCLPTILSDASQVVIDADAINFIANDSKLQDRLQARAHRNQQSILTPHPLEAARLLNVNVATVQGNRLEAASTLCKRFQCTVVLKGTGTVIAAPDETCHINPTGNPRLATAGTGDVLAGMIGARLASGQAPFLAAIQSVYHHGQIADQWSQPSTLTASALAAQL